MWNQSYRMIIGTILNRNFLHVRGKNWVWPVIEPFCNAPYSIAYMMLNMYSFISYLFSFPEIWSIPELCFSFDFTAYDEASSSPSGYCLIYGFSFQCLHFPYMFVQYCPHLSIAAALSLISVLSVYRPVAQFEIFSNTR